MTGIQEPYRWNDFQQCGSSAYVEAHPAQSVPVIFLQLQNTEMPYITALDRTGYLHGLPPHELEKTSDESEIVQTSDKIKWI